MKTFIFALFCLNLTACSTAGFIHGFKCSYVNCNTSREMDMSREARIAEGNQRFSDTDLSKRVQAARDRNPEMAKKIDSAVSDDTVVVTRKTDRSGNIYYEAR